MTFQTTKMCYDTKVTHDSRKENIHNPFLPKIKNQKNQITHFQKKKKIMGL